MSNNLLDHPGDTEQYGGAGFSNHSGHNLPKDHLGRRLSIAIVISLIVNIVVWTVVAQIVHTRLVVPLLPATFRRMILPPPPKPPKVRHKIIPPKPKPPIPVKQAVIPQQVKRTNTPPPMPPQHNRILTAKGPTSSTATALPGGSVPLGKPIEAQAPQVTAPPPPPSTPAVEQPQADPAPPPAQPPPPAPKPVIPAGPTLDAQSSNQVYPDIPSDVESDDYKSFVRVKVNIAANGSFTVTLVSSSGNDEVDQRVLDALRRWRWSPALVNGVPIESTERFRFNFIVN